MHQTNSTFDKSESLKNEIGEILRDGILNGDINIIQAQEIAIYLEDHFIKNITDEEYDIFVIELKKMLLRLKNSENTL